MPPKANRQKSAKAKPKKVTAKRARDDTSVTTVKVNEKKRASSSKSVTADSNETKTLSPLTTDPKADPDDCDLCFCDHVRKTCPGELAAAFGCCLITNAEEELRALYRSAPFVHDGSAIEINNWATGASKHAVHTLFIGGEGGSGKTRAALQCPKFYRAKYGQLKQDDVLTVFIKVSRENIVHWNKALEEKDEDTKKAVKVMKDMWKKKEEEYKGLYGTYQSNDFLEVCIKECTTEKVTLRRLRAMQCHDWLCGFIKDAVPFTSGMKSKNLFKTAFIVLDEVSWCPWIYRAVNGNPTDEGHISKHFGEGTSFAEKYRFICPTRVSTFLISDMINSPDPIYSVSM
ncbi:hypothetical protein AGDE_16794 [Angomonas deanei]|uniref:Uncharacterized protein n=1 Tax=Angomonas deanei TaxID=59799 RepID=A0A7G2CFS7_9TRYP|nr:hypothetical protein AGDE_16794 [Angomonas deanei]CAD2217877.1 hypothetical protein, conserved [Angomonas deanei]|eukprot:EPY16179.1 hypothetical protein AGDE_16794 [Angomonas deanei]